MLSINDFFLSESLKKLLNKWIKEDFKVKPLCIFGKSGIGKTSLANAILKDYKTINIDTDFIKVDKDFKEYIDMSLGKKNICMMFNKSHQKNELKSILFDDIHVIQQLDKPLFKQIINWKKNYKIKYSNHPIIFIIPDTCVVKKIFKEIVDNSLLFEIKYTDNNFNKLVTKLLNSEKIIISLNHIQKLLKISGKNISNIKSNIELLRDKSNETIDIVIEEKEFSGELNEITYKIMNDKFDIQNILSNAYCDYNIISLNLLDNLSKFFTKDFLKDYLYIYKNICLGDKMNSEMIVDHNYELFDYIIMHQVLFPIFNIKKSYSKCIKELNYNKYISKSIYYISNQNTYIKNNLNMHSVFYELYLYDYKIDKDKNINKKLLEKYIKIYNWIYNRNIKKNDLIK
tara:strand:- start:1103 stop:2302 length:1200 start_codon:yes stop_codon:yes gene_type:complete